jgi:hypothetical protein
LLLLSPQTLAVIAMHELLGLLLKKTAGTCHYHQQQQQQQQLTKTRI